jgi:hypothetical protein
MEMSHRGKAYLSIARQAEADLRELLAIPSSYKVLFLQGGASQFCHGAHEPDPRGQDGGLHQHRRLVEEGDRGGQALSAPWRRGEFHPGRKFTSVPPRAEWKLNPGDAAYVHYTPNETIGGVEFPYVPTPAACRWSPTCPRRCCRGRSMSPEIRPDLRRRAEEHRSGRPDHRHRARGPDRRSRMPGTPVHARLQDPRRQRVDV